MSHSSFYSKYLFVPDLILISIWALFALKSAWIYQPYVAAIILFRAILSFQMRYRLNWSILSATAFCCLYIYNPEFSCFEDAIISMTDYIWLAVGNTGQFPVFNSGFFASDANPWICAMQIIWLIWNAFMPILVAYTFISKYPKHVKRRLLSMSIGIAALFIGVSVCLNDYYLNQWEFGVYLMLCAAPSVFFLSNNQRRKRLETTVASDKSWKLYLGFVALFVTSFVIGQREIYSVKPFCFIAFVPILYCLLNVSFKSRIHLILIPILGASGYLFSYAVEYGGYKETLIRFSTGFTLLIITAVYSLIRNKNDWKPALLLALIVPTVLVPLLYGLNPYKVMESERTHPNWFLVNGRRGVYVTSNENMQYGLRDRYGEILPIKYKSFKSLDGFGRYAAVCQGDYGYDDNDIWMVYDLVERKFLYSNDEDFTTSMINQTDDDNVFKLIDSNGRWFSNLHLPGFYDGEFYSNAWFSPNYDNSIVPLEDFIIEGNREFEKPNDEYDFWTEMYSLYPREYELMSKISTMPKWTNSPMTDLYYGQAVRYFVNEDKVYRGNMERALSDIEDMLTNSITTSTANMLTVEYYLRMIEEVRLYNEYYDFMMEHPVYKDEYISWHNLMEVISHYRDYVDRMNEWVYVRDLDDEMIITEEYRSRKEQLWVERDIVNYRITAFNQSDSLKTEKDIQQIFVSYHSDKSPDYYHPLWHEVKPAFEAWIEQRERIASTLKIGQSDLYRAYTGEVINWLYDIISPLDVWTLRPALNH